ncbi:MAG: T9SS type A sorting domain-containing protein [Chitinophagaceae bacterium]|nr:T9SS type A sorting domain-containing protein [Chitinophagaceae bacterium]
MKKNSTVVIVCLLIISGLQHMAFSQDLNHCGATEMQLKLWAQYPELWQAQQDYDQQIRDQIAASDNTRDEDEVYIIPIVFHVIHNYGSEYISDEQIEDQVRVLNDDYRKMNADTAAIVNAFLGIAGDAHIEFRLAKKTSGGGCTTGIDRIQSHETYQGNDGSKLSQWPRNMYLNVWTVNKMQNGVAGYAYYPSSVAGFLAPYDGIMILSDYIGSIGSSSVQTSRALTHEIGHYLNLPHTWGSTNSPGVECGDDGVQDTPETKGWTSCNLSGAVCNAGVIENVQNYMEYAYCSKMFTEGQIAIMRGILNNPVSDRDNLWSASNLIATGTNDGYVAECAPRADFNPKFYNICQGADIAFTNFSWGGDASSWSWDIPGGTPSTSTEESPVIVFNEAGKHTITLTATNAAGSSTVSKDIYVSPPTPSYSHYYFEDFEDVNKFNNDWIIRNIDGNGSEWALATNAAYEGSHCARIDNFNGDQGDVDYMISPAMDLSGMGEINLSFRYAAASGSSNVTNINDALRIYTSSNCGESWYLRNVRSGLDLINNGAYGNYFTPGATTGTWSLATVSFPSIVAQPNIRIKFEFTGGSYGNNLYIDDIAVSEYGVGIQSPASGTAALNIFPNPNNGDFTLTYSLPEAAEVRVSIIDLTGREIFEVSNEQQAAGSHQQSVQADAVQSLSKGIYFLRMQSNGETNVKKLVIE